ncbi:MAG: sugar phosphate nucleotidyltransferase [Candidatus Omnitrophica bacterium]|nr:sugar phosphate nucleotidyltransferase [Candidatus Omnitrophota bacterium]MDD5610188.1 sugar phosphate nucleotidyltransferase [Candidatus Omnitrophota bacterium]
MIYAVILAGGKGERFWPLSDENTPKQFHCLYSNLSMLQETIARVLPLVAPRNIYVSTNRQHRAILEKQLKKFSVPAKNIFFEASPKSTLAPVSFLSRAILSRDKGAVIAVFPSDHFIDDRKKLASTLRRAAGLAQKGYIVCLGKQPDYPQTGYGYIKLGREISSRAYRVKKFIEKPAKDRARRFVRSKQYLWNCGIFIFKAETLMEELRRYAPGLYRNLKCADIHAGTKRIWDKLPSISIDYGIMERTKKAAVVRIDHLWSDVGDWKGFSEMFKKDKFNISFKGRVIDLDCKNTTILSSTNLSTNPVAAIGLNNIIIVNTEDGLLVCAKDHAQDVKKIVPHLKTERPK